MNIGFFELQEKRLLSLSLLIASLFVLVAFSFAFATHSDAILFDAIYSLIAFLIALLTLKVANLVQRPDDDRFHFGYTAIEPTLNMFKSIIIIVMCLYAVTSSINTLLSGGSSAEYDVGLIYGVVATLGCFGISIYMKLKSKNIRSDLIAVDSRTWFIDGVLSASILCAFALAYGIQHTAFAHYAPYVDPVLLIVLGVAMLPIPGRILLDSLNEVINKAPPESVSRVIEKKLKKTLVDVPYEHVEVRISKRGRDVYLLVHIIVDDSFRFATVSDLDDIRIQCEAEMRAWDPAIIMDILFIRDPELAE